jgi:hypothetical protein
MTIAPDRGTTTTTKEEGTSFLYWDRDNHGGPDRGKEDNGNHD